MANLTEYSRSLNDYIATENYIGFDDIAICRPKFIYFKVTGMWPNKRHFAFIDKIEVSNYINTSGVAITDFGSLGRNDNKRNPGDKYTSETGYPTELGGPTQIYSDDNGIIEGILYLQSNETLNFPAGTRTIEFFDVSTPNPDNAISYAATTYISNAGIENYEVEYTVRPKPPAPPPTSPSNNGSNNNDNDDNFVSPYATVWSNGSYVGTFEWTNAGETPDHTNFGPGSGWSPSGGNGAVYSGAGSVGFR